MTIGEMNLVKNSAELYGEMIKEHCHYYRNSLNRYFDFEDVVFSFGSHNNGTFYSRRQQDIILWLNIKKVRAYTECVYGGEIFDDVNESITMVEFTHLVTFFINLGLEPVDQVVRLLMERHYIKKKDILR